MVLVTGASGFVGGHVARLLMREGASLRILLRRTSNAATTEHLKAERIYGDLTDPASLRTAVAGCRTVFHVAADYRLWAPDPRVMYAANVAGTANLLDAAAEAGVERIVYTSTVGCMGWPPDGGPANEDVPVSLAAMSGHYKRSKFQAERAALERAQRGVPVVVVNPTAPVGEEDWKPTPTGRTILDFLRGRMPAYIDTGLNLVDVRAVAAGHLAAAQRGRIGERYVLADRNMEFREILEVLARLSGRRAPRVKIPWAVAYAAAAAESVLARITGHEPRIPIEGVKLARHKMFVSSGKAKRELGFEPGNVEEALERAVRWFLNDRHLMRSAP
jgi:dihydroflavonol-4-reductase